MGTATGPGGGVAPFVHLPPLPGALAPARVVVNRSQDVGQLFPAITPSPGAAAPHTAPPAGVTAFAGGFRLEPAQHETLVGDDSLPVTEPLGGHQLAGLILIGLLAAGAVAGLWLSRSRKPSPAAASSPGTAAPGTAAAPAAFGPGPAQYETSAAGGGGSRPGGHRRAGLVVIVLLAAGTAAGLRLGRIRKRRVL